MAAMMTKAPITTSEIGFHQTTVTLGMSHTLDMIHLATYHTVGNDAHTTFRHTCYLID